MRTEINRNQGSYNRQRVFVEPHLILRYFLIDDDKLNTIIMCKRDDTELYTTDRDLYEAMCSIEPHDTFKVNKLAKFLETVDVLSYKKETGKRKPIMSHERVEELRTLALKK